MRVSKLKILGFKSFAEKVELSFGPGITALVGPNGCGKTNVVEALRWVLGEQNPRVLRCSRMDEVVFAGSSARKPLGMAEVAINLEDDGGGLPGGSAELEVTRRLFKDGQSDYVVNRQPALLREIKDIFLDVGLGAEGYSLLERDMVDQVLKDPTGTRRTILEQASGIARYRDRSRRASAKLEASAQDMLRLQDLLGEVKTQVISLARQAGKAERYRECQQEIRMLSRNLIAHEHEQLLAKTRDLERQAGRSDRRRRKAMEKLQDSEHTLREAAGARHTAEREITDAKQSLEVLDRETDDARRHERFLSERMVEERQRASSLEERRKRETERLSRIKSEGLQIARSVADLRRQNLTLQEEERAFRGTLEETRGRRTALLRQIEQLAEVMQGERTRALAEQRERGRLIERKRLGCERLERLRQQERRAEERLERLEARRDELISARDGAREAVAELRHELTLSRSKLDALETHLSGLVKDSTAIASRVEFLTALQEEGDSPFQDMLDSEGVVGSLGQLVSAESGWESLVDGALADAAQWLVVRSWPHAIRIASRAADLPRGTVLVLEEFLRWTAPDSRDRTGSVAEHVTADADVQLLVRHLLGDTVAVDDLDAARRVIGEEGWARAVTGTGEVLERSGAVEVGKLRAVISNKQRLADEQKQLAQTERARRNALRDVEDLRAACEDLAKRLQDEQGRELVCRSEARRVDDELAELASARDRLGQDSTALEQEIEAIPMPAGEVETSSDSSELEALRRQDRSLAAEEAEVSAKLAQLGRTSAGMTGKAEGMVGELCRLAALRREARASVAEAAGEIALTRERISGMSRELEELTAKLAAAERGREPLAAKVANLEEQLGRAAEQVEALEARRASAWQQLEECRESLHTVQLDQARLTATYDALRERALRELGCTLEDLGKPTVAGSPQEMSERIAVLTRRREALGSVNFAAEQEHAHAKERYDYLDAQLRDLTEARDALERAMARMRETARELFLATLEQVRANFRYTFGELFQGGEADLRLIDEDHPLESGVDIVACPGGKRLRKIEALSGGEKALTAIALLFAVYLVAPSPFCILDEVDAPLDDANVERFIGVLRSFATGSQFVIVTHNRRTMKAADVLYGVTMGEPGVSQIVSVRLPDDSQ